MHGKRYFQLRNHTLVDIQFQLIICLVCMDICSYQIQQLAGKASLPLASRHKSFDFCLKSYFSLFPFEVMGIKRSWDHINNRKALIPTPAQRSRSKKCAFLPDIMRSVKTYFPCGHLIFLSIDASRKLTIIL